MNPDLGWNSGIREWRQHQITKNENKRITQTYKGTNQNTTTKGHTG